METFNQTNKKNNQAKKNTKVDPKWTRHKTLTKIKLNFKFHSRDNAFGFSFLWQIDRCIKLLKIHRTRNRTKKNLKTDLFVPFFFVMFGSLVNDSPFATIQKHLKHFSSFALKGWNVFRKTKICLLGFAWDDWQLASQN